MLVVDFLRHGALEGGVKYRGTLDEALTTVGRVQMDKVWAQIKHEVTTIISSPLSRCALPAQDWASEANVSCVISNQVAELNYGNWEGLTSHDIEQKYPNMLQAWRENPTDMTPPNGESMQFFAERTLDFWQKLLESHDDEHLLVVAHSGSIRLLLAHVLAAPIQTTRHIAMPYACWSRIEIQDGQAQLVFHAKDT